MASVPVAVVLLVSVATVKVATDVARKAARRAVLPASSLLSSVVDLVVAVVVTLLLRRCLAMSTHACHFNSHVTMKLRCE
jgi:hypothetical protein